MKIDILYKDTIASYDPECTYAHTSRTYNIQHTILDYASQDVENACTS